MYIFLDYICLNLPVVYGNKDFCSTTASDFWRFWPSRNLVKTCNGLSKHITLLPRKILSDFPTVKAPGLLQIDEVKAEDFIRLTKSKQRASSD